MNTLLTPTTAEHLGDFRLGDQLGLDIEEPERLSFLESTVSAYRTPTATGVRYDVVLDHAPLDGLQLMDFLYQVAPYKDFRFGLGGVAGDWDVVDRAASGSDGAKRLTHLHHRLGQSWVDFMASRPAFLGVAHDAMDPYFPGTYANRDRLIPTNDLTKSDFYNRLLVRATASPSAMIELLEHGGVIAPEGLVIRMLANEVNKKRQGYREVRPHKLEDRYNSWGSSRKRSFVRHLFRTQIPIHKADTLIDSDGNSVFDTITAEDGRSYSYPNEHLEEGLSVAYEKRERVTSRHYEAQQIILRFKDGKTEPVLIPGSIHEVEGFVARTIQPHIAWETEHGSSERKFILERAEEDRVITDGVLGVLAVAYASPQITSSWRNRMKIPMDKGKPKERRARDGQEIGIAQVPVLALMRGSQLLGSDLVQTVESMAA